MDKNAYIILDGKVRVVLVHVSRVHERGRSMGELVEVRGCHEIIHGVVWHAMRRGATSWRHVRMWNHRGIRKGRHRAHEAIGTWPVRHVR